MKVKIGTGKHDLTCFIPGIGMMGYGQPHNIVKEIATPLWARALFIEHGTNQHFILVHLEQAFVTLAIKEEVLNRLSSLYPDLGITYANLAITAQHTHSAPGGYSHYPLYNFTIPGFQKKIFETIVKAILEAIKEAKESAEIAEIKFGQHTIDSGKEIAFNRSMRAHARNPEAQHSKEEEKHLAVDRTMEGLSFVTNEGKVKAYLNWFSVHGTSISSYNQRIHHDNKGVAAELFERSSPGTTAFFLQSAAGDVSPNFLWDKKSKLMRGKFSDQYESASFNGELQFQEAQKVECDKIISEAFSSQHVFMDMSLVVGAPAHGVAFFLGTLEGPGVPKPLGKVLAGVSKIVRKVHLIKDEKKHREFYEAQGNKDVLLDHRNGSFLGIPLNAWKKFPKIPDPTVEAFRKTAKAQALETLPWVPPILPFQILRLGQILIAFAPGEVSVMAGRRLKKYLKEELKDLGIEEVILTTYANAYMGYIVTPEEYDEQCYEGGHTVYGRNSLAGIKKGFSYLVKRLKGEEIDEVLPLTSFHFPPEELERRSL